MSRKVVQVREVERGRGLPLAARDVVEAGAVDLRAIGGVVDADGDDAGGEGVEHDAELREDEVDEEDLDQQRRRADELDERPRSARPWPGTAMRSDGE